MEAKRVFVICESDLHIYRKYVNTKAEFILNEDIVPEIMISYSW